LTMISWAYLAGFLDGDGWITKNKNKNCGTESWTIGWTQTARERVAMTQMRDWMHQRGIRSSMVDRTVKTQILDKSQMVNIHVKEQKSALRLLLNIRSHLLMKKHLAEACITHLRSRIRMRGDTKNPVPTQPTNVRWTRREIVRLKSMHESGYRNRAIASALGRSKHSVAQKLCKLGMTRSRVRIANEED
jgi:hypothetical protein